MHSFYQHSPGMEPSGEESDRLSTLRGYEILDSLPEQNFNQIAEAASKACGTPFALISFLDKDRQWFKAKVGLDLQQMDRTHAFCHFCIQNEGEILEIPDTQEEKLYRENPLVKEHPYIRFYAGAPIPVKEGHFLGSVCVMDQVPRKLTTDQRRILEILASQVRDNMELRLSRIKMEKAYEQEISKRVLESEVEERRHIGQELHDGVVQTLAAANMHVNMIRENGKSSDERERCLARLQEMLDQASQEIRGIGHSLMGKQVRENGLQKALESLASCYAPLENTPQVMTAMSLDDASLEDVEAINLYRIAQEFIHNSIKHSNASTVWLKGSVDDEGVWMTLEDDGKGLDGKEQNEFGGMRNMEHRIHSLGGRFHINSTPGRGMRLTIELRVGRKKEREDPNSKGQDPSHLASA